MKYLLLLLTFFPVLASAQFSDVLESHPHAEAIRYVHSEGIVDGYTDGTYKPDATINRVEFLKILLEFRNQNIHTCQFSADIYTDTDDNAWYMDYLHIATCNNVVEGYQDGSFGPGNSINYAEAAKIITQDSLSSAMADYGDVWYEKYITWIDMWEATPREDIEPSDLLTRGEMAQIIFAISANEPTSNTPNILLIIADDMGLDAAPWHLEIGSKKPYTPVLSNLSEQGVVFENVWSNPVCSPTRAGILTGKYGVHTGVLGPLKKTDLGIQVDEYTLQQHITAQAPQAYAQAVIGKWHLSTSNNGTNDNPERMGVPYYSGFISGSMQDYFSWEKVTNGQTTQEDTYATTAFTDEAILWTQTQQDPWFLWLAYTAPHTPFHTPPEHLVHTPPDDTKISQYFAAIEAMDTEIGRLLESLSPEERENTLVIFMGDNGTPAQVAQAPYSTKKSKGSVFQGGVHIPMIIAGAGITPRREEALINTTDLFATIAELAGAPLINYENSQSIVPVLYGETPPEREYAYAEIHTTSKNTDTPSKKNGWTVRDKQYKYIQLDNGTEYFFDLLNDPYEENNLITSAQLVTEIHRVQQAGMHIRGDEK